MDFKVGDLVRFKTEEEIDRLIENLDEFYKALIKLSIKVDKNLYKEPITITHIIDDNLIFESEGREVSLSIAYFKIFNNPNNPNDYEVTDKGFKTHSKNWKNGLDLV